MNYSTEQVVRGLISYADNEVMAKLPVSGKWIMGTAVGLAANKTSNIIDTLKNNTVVNMLGIMDENGNMDVDALINAMREAADKYGKLTVQVPMIGSLTFSSADIDKLRSYIQ